MIKIQFVCHGNICRSPMAEMILKDIIRKNGREGEFLVASSAVSAEELGSPLYPPAAAVMRQAGIPIDKTKRAVKFTARDYEEFDHIYVMDRSNLRRMEAITGGDPQGKVQRLLDAAGLSGDVEDPWYSGNFDSVFRQIYDACRRLSEQLEILVAQ